MLLQRPAKSSLTRERTSNTTTGIHVTARSVSARGPTSESLNIRPLAGASSFKRGFACRLTSVRTCALTVAPVAAPLSPGGAAEGASKGPKVLSEIRFEDAGLGVKAELHGDMYQVDLWLEQPRNMLLHWSTNDWQAPDQSLWPAGTYEAGGGAVQSAFGGDGKLTLYLPQDKCPARLVWVLRQTDPELWFNNNGINYSIQLKAPGVDSVMDKAVSAEAENSHWSLFQRLVLAAEVLEAADAAGPAGMAFMHVWLRLSSTRVLDWYRKSNYQSKDIAHTQKYVAERFAAKARESEGGPWSRMLARMTLAGLPRGGGNGDDIRMGILNIMRANGIKEGHRPGHDEPFLEQWHQKLHTNTTPDDVAICRAYLAFLHSGNHDDYWRVLWDTGKLTKEKMAAFSKPISAVPHHLPHLIPAFQHYEWILKVTHSGADLDTAFEMAKGLMDDETRWTISDMLQNRYEWWVPGKIVVARQQLAKYALAPGASRDLLLLDIALDNWLRTRVEVSLAELGSMKGDDIMGMLDLVLRNELVAWPQGTDLAYCANWWGRLMGDAAGPRWSRDWSLEALAACERTQLALASHMDTLYGLVQPYAERFGTACKLDRAHIANFGEEVVRGCTLALLAPLAAALQPSLRKAAGVASWQVASQPASGWPTGRIERVAALADVQGLAFDTQTILLCDKVGGTEDIPQGIVSVLSPCAVDVLSHLAIRARAQNVLLASSFDPQEWSAWQDLAGQSASVTVDAEGAVVPGHGHDNGSSAFAPNGSGGKLQVMRPKGTQHWALTEDEFEPGLVGAKAANLAFLRSRLPQGVHVPASISLPFGTFERVLDDPANTKLSGHVRQLSQAAASARSLADAADLLHELRTVVSTQLAAPAALVSELASVAVKQGLIDSPQAWAPNAGNDSPVAWPATWSAICTVWASKWSDRAWLSRQAVGLPDQDLFMSVLLQRVVPSQYAFVLHTKNPVSGQQGEMLGEVVVGMGESLVGNSPGRALAFTAFIGAPGSAPTAAGGSLDVHALPSKRMGLFAPAHASLIARSDANAEDLEEYAAAGLYDSVTLQPLKEEAVDYAGNPLIYDAGFRIALLESLTHLGADVRDAMAGNGQVLEQDVEGAWVDGQLYVVQSRPQV